MGQAEVTRSQAEEMVSIVAHDLRNPLACIEGYTGLMLAKDMPQEERAKLLSRILSCSRFMEQIIEDLLDTAALERGELTVKKSQVQLPDLLHKALDAMSHSATSRRVTLSLSGTEVTLPVMGDASRLQQVVQNLVSNAIKHVPQGTGRVELRVHDLDRELVVEVSDNGEGIAPEHIDHVFEKFYSADGERARGSLGLGLFIATQIVEQHGGRLWVKSEGKGRGTSFYFSVPKSEPERAFNEYKALRRLATPPPRRIPELAPIFTPSLSRGLALQLALAGALLAAYAGLSHLRQQPSSPMGLAYTASTAPLLP